MLGISCAQVQKYESGKNRVSCSRLYDIAKIFNVHTSYFFIGFEGDTTNYPAVDRSHIIAKALPLVQLLRCTADTLDAWCASQQ